MSWRVGYREVEDSGFEFHDGDSDFFHGTWQAREVVVNVFWASSE
jgi:hypothetical protein